MHLRGQFVRARVLRTHHDLKLLARAGLSFPLLYRALCSRPGAAIQFSPGDPVCPFPRREAEAAAFMALHFILQGLAESRSLEEERWDLRVDYVSLSSHSPRPVHFASSWFPGSRPHQRWRRGWAPARDSGVCNPCGFWLFTARLKSFCRKMFAKEACSARSRASPPGCESGRTRARGRGWGRGGWKAHFTLQ